MNCTNPIDAAILADYWMAVLTPAKEEGIEEHLLACGACSARLGEIAALIEAVRKLAREGALRMVVSEGVLKRAREEGLTVREYAPQKGGGVQCTVTAHDDMLIARLAADMSGTKSVDLSLCDKDGAEMIRLPDIPVRSAPGEVILQESITFAKAAPDNVMIARLVAHDESGGERLLGEYTFNHTRSLPGKGSW